jgi:hypothetical protein
MNKLFLLILPVIFATCTEKQNPQEIIDLAIEKHGGQLFITKKVAFDFRNKQYSVEYENGKKTYTRSFQDDSLGAVKDLLINSSNFNRYINDSLIVVNDEWRKKYSNSINSVLYFFKLPFGLNDPAVIKEYIGEKYINNKGYHKIKITFKQEDGGEDYQDVFIYWIEKETYSMDYLAYSYATDEGGSRFRQAINKRVIDGITVQNYINYKANSKSSSIDNHDELFIQGKLIELSIIINEQIRIFNQK